MKCDDNLAMVISR